MATILELAQHAGVSAESVLRVVNGEPVSGDVTERVNKAIEALGPPRHPRWALQPVPGPVDPDGDMARDELLETFTAAAAKLEQRLPEDVGNVVYEAVRVEVRPMAQHLAQMEELFQQVVRRIDEVRESERRERLDDVALMIELITTGWRSVDRRLGRLERMLARLETERDGDQPSARSTSTPGP